MVATQEKKKERKGKMVFWKERKERKCGKRK